MDNETGPLAVGPFTEAESSPQSEPRALLFDIGNVVIHYDHRITCRRLGKVAGLGEEEVFRKIFDHPLRKTYEEGHISSRDLHEAVCSLLAVSLPFDRFKQIWTDIFEPSPDMEELVRRLAPRYPLYIVSNTDELHYSFLIERYPILSHFRAHILSFQCGATKPSAAIYRLALEQACVRPAEAIFIDDVQANVEGAETLGIRALRFRGTSALRTQLISLGVTL